MGLLHLSQSYVPDRFPPDSQEEYMPKGYGYGKKKPMKPKKSKKPKGK